MAAARKDDSGRSKPVWPTTIIAAAYLLGALLAATYPSPSGAQESVFRSAAEPRRWPPDERQQPRYAERGTHRGYEILTGPVHVVATTSLDDARLAAQQATEAWSDISMLADHWTASHRQPNFAQGAVQIVIDAEQVRKRDEPLVALGLVDHSTQITINVASGQPSLTAQQGELRRAAAMAFLHTAELDQRFPAWVCQGLAAYVGTRATGTAAAAPTAGTVGNSAPIDTNRWRATRLSPDRLEEPLADRPDAARLVQFLIEGNDARHAGAFFDLLREQVESVRPSDEAAFQRAEARPLARPDSGKIDQLVTDLSSEFARWQEDPLIGQPVLAEQETGDESLRQKQQEMLLVLKLADRFAESEPTAIRTRVTTFAKDRRISTLTSASAAGQSSRRTLPERITMDNQPTWATIGPDGNLIWNDERNKLRELLGIDDDRYQHAWENNRWVLKTPLANGRQLIGWLEPNPENSQRPLAKFAQKSPAPSIQPGH